jgi:hypothetical protein
MSLAALAAAPLFAYAMHGNASSRDLGWVGVAAERRLERLREQPFDSLIPGGSVTADVTGYFDTSQPDVVVRWKITDNSAAIPQTKIVTVRALRTRVGYGPAGRVTTITLRGN